MIMGERVIIFQISVGDPRFVVGRLIDFLICVGTGLFCMQVVARIQSHLASNISEIRFASASGTIDAIPLRFVVWRTAPDSYTPTTIWIAPYTQIMEWTRPFKMTRSN